MWHAQITHPLSCTCLGASGATRRVAPDAPRQLQTFGPRLGPRFPRDRGLQLLILSGDQAEAFGWAKQFGCRDLWEALSGPPFAPTNDLASLWPAGACTSTDTIVSPFTTANVRRNIGTSRTMRQTESRIARMARNAVVKK